MVVESVVILLNGYRPGGTLTIQVLPNTRPATQGLLLDLRNDPNRDPTLAAIQLLEGTEYRYQFDLADHRAVSTDRPELFERDDRTGRSGRLRPGLSTGTVPIEIRVGQDLVAKISLEVRSRKLDYLSQYRWMLRDLAESTAEIITERFAASQQSFSSLANVDAKTLYQRFAFLQSLLEDEPFVAALHRIVHRPYIAWNEIPEQRSPNQSVRAGSAVARSVAKPGPRVRGASHPEALETAAWRSALPRKISIQRTEETLDNFPNRFVKFALTRWRDQSAAVLDALSRELPTAPVTRGRAEATKVTALLDEFLTAGLFREVGHLSHFASDNPVLLQREGYRDVYRAFLQFELAAQLSWEGGEDVYGAGQRNVATLYEYWAFLQVGLVLSKLCGKQFDFANLFSLNGNELNLELRRGRSLVLTGSVSRFGRTILLDFCFNRTFSAGRNSPSWSKEMRPDCSLRLRPDRTPGDEVDDVWVHFDAKYRVDRLTEIFGQSESSDALATKPVVISTEAKRDDLLKMHAYRDAIYRSAGAYVLYPGDSDEQCKKFHELLPGLGAFGLRPASDGDAVGTESLTAFLNDVVSHVASQATQYERSRFWERRSFSGLPHPEKGVPAVSFLNAPPADTKVLLGYVKDANHRAWIERNGLYNLRADSSRRGSVNLDSGELAATLALMYGRDREMASLYRINGRPLLKTRDEMLASGYSNPRGVLYYCLPVAAVQPELEVPPFSATMIGDVVFRRQALPVVGMPIVISWLELLGRLVK